MQRREESIKKEKWKKKYNIWKPRICTLTHHRIDSLCYMLQQQSYVWLCVMMVDGRKYIKKNNNIGKK